MLETKNSFIKEDSFASLHYAQNDNKLAIKRGGDILAAKPPKYPLLHPVSCIPCHSEQSEESVSSLVDTTEKSYKISLVRQIKNPALKDRAKNNIHMSH